MASKTDLKNLEESISKNTKIDIAEAVDPLKSELCDLKKRIKTIEDHKAQNPGESSTPQNTKVVKDLQNALNKLDPALRRTSFFGWPDTVSAEKRVELMRKFGSEKYPGFNPTDVGHDETGPYSNRKLTKSSWIEFSNTDTAKQILKKTKMKHLLSKVQASK